MHDAQKDTDRAKAAAMALLDGRDHIADRGAILVTLEHAVSMMLMLTMDQDTKKASQMLNEGLAPGVDMRLAHAAQMQQR